MDPMPRDEDIDPDSGGPTTSSGRPVLAITYKLRLSDLYWMWETSWVGLPVTIFFVGGAVWLFSALFYPSSEPITADVAAGLLVFVLAPFFGPAVGIFTTGKWVLRGRTIHLKLDEEGLNGWSVPYFRQTSWVHLRHARFESRVLVLPFSWPFADSWAVIPARALSPGQYDKLLAKLGEHGFLQDGNHRSRLGRMLGFALDRGPLAQASPHGKRLRRFPTDKERAAMARPRSS
jgi:hypothetical protein